MWESLPDTDCTWLHCLWSETEQSNIDLWLEPLTTIDQGPLSVGGACPHPTGGQTVQSNETPPLVAFIITMHNNGLTAAQCLLEIFRCGQCACTALESSCALLCNVGLQTVRVVHNVMIACDGPWDRLRIRSISVMLTSMVSTQLLSECVQLCSHLALSRSFGPVRPG